jgi:hypothetical protein
MPPRFVLTFFAPFIMGGGDGRLFRAPYMGPAFAGEYIAYVGAVTLMLALVALLLKPDGRTKFWALIAGICLALAFGRFLPLDFYKLVYHVPVLNLFRPGGPRIDGHRCVTEERESFAPGSDRGWIGFSAHVSDGELLAAIRISTGETCARNPVARP